MRRISRFLLFVMFITIIGSLMGCTALLQQEGAYIISAKTAIKLLENNNVILIDAQKLDAFEKQHIKGAINISRKDIVINKPVPNMLLGKKAFENLMRENGISKNSVLIIYDNNKNMDASRLWWTLKVYGHQDTKVVSGGLKALIKAGAKIESGSETIKQTTSYTADELDTSLIATTEDVLKQVNRPRKNVKIIDVRSETEWAEGIIPGAILINFEKNNNENGTFKSVQNIKLKYRDLNVREDDTVILYCKSSIRAAQTLLALYNAGYSNVKLYDGAWLEWTLDENRPIEMPDSISTSGEGG